MSPNPVYQLNSMNWQQLYVTTRSREIVEDTVALPIPPLTIPFVASAELLAIALTTTGNNGRWRYGGLLKIGFRTGLAWGGSQNAVSNNVRKLFLGSPQLIRVQKYAPEYSLEYSAPNYFPDFSLTIYEYSGPITYPDMVLLESINKAIAK